MKIGIIIASVRPGRVGENFGQWFYRQAKQRSDFETELIDLKDWPFTTYDEPNHPKTGKYEHDLTKRWSQLIGGLDGYVIVTPEYNHGYPGNLKIAMDHIYNEWAGKPVGFVSYGGNALGTRSVEQLRQVSIELHMAPIREAMFFSAGAAFDADGKLRDGDEAASKAAATMLDELAWWARALKTAREQVVQEVSA